MRILNAILYVFWTGCQWQPMPKELLMKSNALSYYMLWDRDSTPEQIHDTHYGSTCVTGGREASVTAAIIDPQIAKA